MQAYINYHNNTYPDFGFALDLQEDISSTPCGSKSYAAPEIHLFDEDKESFDAKKTDVWSL